MGAWIARQLASAPVMDDSWTRELYRAYGRKLAPEK